MNRILKGERHFDMADATPESGAELLASMLSLLPIEKLHFSAQFQQPARKTSFVPASAREAFWGQQWGQHLRYCIA